MYLADLQLPRFMDVHLHWFVACAVLTVSFIVAGFGDLGRFSFTRIWAISGVCFQESIRRRVLWIVPLAILGVVVAVQLLNPLDEQDAIRQTIKYSLFATATLVVLVTIILACTNLPKEIENRVIFTIVTKPTTRLEIVLGKVVGFARVSAALLAIMGLFTWGYAGLKAGRMQAHAKERVDSLPPSDPSRAALRHYADAGLLQSKSYVKPVDFQQFAIVPKPSDPIHWINGNDEESFVVGFDLPPEMFPTAEAQAGAAPPDNGGLVVRGAIHYEYHEGHQEWHPTPFPGDLPDPVDFKGFHLKDLSNPTVTFDILGPDHFNLIPPTELDERGQARLSFVKRDQVQDLIKIKSSSLDRLLQYPEERRRIYCRIVGSGAIRYGVGRDSIRLFSPRLASMGKDGIVESIKDPEGKPAWPALRGREVSGGQQLKGGADLGKISTGVFSFRGLPGVGQSIPLELRVGIEGAGDEVSGNESITRAVVQAYNLKTGQLTEPIEFPIESNRTAYFTLPASATEGGDFNVQVRCLGPGHYLIIRGLAGSLAMQVATGKEPFALNLFKSLLVMWLMSVLVVMVAIFCSTFVSWPIAVVLTVVILMAHWGAVQIADSNGPGAGAGFAKDMGFRNPGEAKVISTAIDNLSRLLNTISKVLPDISQFSATEDIERGVTIPPRVLFESGKVILAFGVPMTVLAYVFLKRKEVAP